MPSQQPPSGPWITRPVKGLVRRGDRRPVECSVSVETIEGEVELSFQLGNERVLLTGDAEATLQAHVRAAGAEKRKAESDARRRRVKDHGEAD